MTANLLLCFLLGTDLVKSCVKYRKINYSLRFGIEIYTGQDSSAVLRLKHAKNGVNHCSFGTTTN